MYFCLLSLITLSFGSCQAEKEGLEVIQPDPKLSIIQPEKDNGSQQITDNFIASVNSSPDDTLDNFLDFLKENEDQSPVSSLLELRSLLLQQKEEKVALQSLVDQIKSEMRGVKSLVKLQSEELQVHAQELSKVWRQLDKEKETRVSLNEHLVSIASDLKTERHGNNQSEVEKKIVKVLGKLTSVVASLHPQKMRDKMANQIRGNVRQNVLKEVREEAKKRRIKEDCSCQKEVLCKLQPMVKVMKGFVAVTKKVAKMANNRKPKENKDQTNMHSIRQGIKQLVKLKLFLPLRNGPKLENTKKALRSLSGKIKQLKNKLWMMKQSLVGNAAGKFPASKLLGKNDNPMESQQEILNSLRQRIFHLEKNIFDNVSSSLAHITTTVDEMSSKMEETLGLPKREILGSLVQLHSKMDAISASTKLWTKSASSSFDRKKILSSNNGSAAVHGNMPNIEAKLSYLDGMFNSQADLLEDTRSLLINSSILHIHQENQELKQSVRIADNELKIIMLIDQLSTLESKLERILGHKLTSPLLTTESKTLDDDIQEAKSIADLTMSGEKEIMNEIESLSAAAASATTMKSTKASSSMDIFIFK